MVAQNPPLDVNSVYAYLLICDHFAQTSAVAIHSDRMVGFVSAYIPPERPSTLFVWQVAVDKTARGTGLASRMIGEIIGRECCIGVAFIEATVNPSNNASAALFASIAKKLGCQLERTPKYGAELFAAEGQADSHEAEDLLRVGPFDSNDTNHSIITIKRQTK